MPIKELSNRQNWIWTISLVILLVICFTVAIVSLRQEAVRSCYDEIEAVTEQAVNTLLYSMELNRRQLQIVAEMLPGDLAGSIDQIQADLDAICASRPMTALWLRLPDDTYIRGGDDIADFGGLPKFSQDAAQIPYISDACIRLDGLDDRYVYQAVPVTQDGNTIGILYGFFDLDTFPSFFTINAYQGQCQLYLVDGNTGDFLMDTWHNQLGNLYDGSLGDRETRSGYSVETMRQDIRNGQEGYFVFRSKTTGDWFYTYYRPAQINNWSMQVTIPEQIVFAQSKDTNMTVFILGTAVIGIIILFLLWIFYYQNRIHRTQKQRILDAQYRYEVQQTLFAAHEDQTQITDALGKVGQMLHAQAAMLMSFKGRFVYQTYCWREENSNFHSETRGRNLVKDFPKMSKDILSGHGVLYYQEQQDKALPLAEQELLKQRDIQNMMLMPLLDSSSQLQGVLCALNMDTVWKDTARLESVSQDFIRALRNMESYRIIHNLGMMDAVTGMKNRNSYELALARYATEFCEGLHCIYIDVNGLHEVNNTYGHNAGDTMLRTIATQIRGVFGDEHAYRIGGDEFVVFVFNAEESEIREKINDLKQSIRRSEYHISAGCAWQDGKHLNLDRLMEDAEEKMYREKQQFYLEQGEADSSRQRNNRLERLVLEKKDTDSFLDLIASHYMGIFIIDLQKDAARVVYNPGYFTDILREHNYRFLDSMARYVEEFVCQQDRKALLEFCDYRKIAEQLTLDTMPKLHYTKLDGTQVRIRIYPSRTYSEKTPEIFWFFEKI